MNQKLENEDNHPPSGLISKVKKFFRNPFFIKTRSVSEVTDFLKDTSGIGIIEFSSHDVIRHPLVRKIIDAYKNFESNINK